MPCRRLILAYVAYVAYVAYAASAASVAYVASVAMVAYATPGFNSATSGDGGICNVRLVPRPVSPDEYLYDFSGDGASIFIG